MIKKEHTPLLKVKRTRTATFHISIRKVAALGADLQVAASFYSKSPRALARRLQAKRVKPRIADKVACALGLALGRVVTRDEIRLGKPRAQVFEMKKTNPPANP